MGKPTPCGPCAYKPPEIPFEIQEYIDYWGVVQNQLRTTMSGVIGLDFNACKSVADGMGIEWDETTITVLKHLEIQLLEEVEKDGKRNNKNSNTGN
jgi:hypothetical protein